MTISQVTSDPTEADLEAKIRATIKHVFSGFSGEIKHQLTFSFQFGHTVYKVDGKQPNSARSRADMVIYQGETALAILELKREGVSLDEGDEKQALSYAKMLVPSPPLVVLTNGSDTRFFETHTGAKWEPTARDDKAFIGLVSKVSKVAQDDLKLAIDTLMGTDSRIWTQAIRSLSVANLQEFTGTWDDPQYRFVDSFLFPRKPTSELFCHLKNGHRLVIVQGSALAGKSNVLRELVMGTENSNDFAVLYMDGGSGAGIIETIADTLTNAMEWPVNEHEARAWLLRVSNAKTPNLIIAIDGLDTEDRTLKKEIEQLSGPNFGSSLRIVLALETSGAKQLSFQKSRNLTPIGHRAKIVEVEELDDDEFNLATHVLNAHGLDLMSGAILSADFREPWVLRETAAKLLSGLEIVGEFAQLVLPIPSTDLISYARNKFEDVALLRQFDAIAKVTLDEAKDRKRPIALRAEFIGTFVLRRQSILTELSTDELKLLVNNGFLLEAKHHQADEFVVYVRQPALLASSLASLMKREINLRNSHSPDVLAEWVSGAASNLPYGDIIAAQALHDALAENILPSGLLNALFLKSPGQRPLIPGQDFALHHPQNGLVKFKVLSEKQLEIDVRGRKSVGEPDEYVSMIEDHSPWRILSHLAGSDVLDFRDGKLVSVQAELLLQIGGMPMTLLPSRTDLAPIATHSFHNQVEIVCHAMGVIEPVTQSIFQYLVKNFEDAPVWIDQALSKKSIALLNRTYMALDQMRKLVGPYSVWATETLDEIIQPAMIELEPFFLSHLPKTKMANEEGLER
ncbi:hypothetical protein CS078_13200 [Pseudomonas prosekii]|uniref:Restriction endonuclease type I HsdR N-terminal domain-containing protein n=1 Tax=Pseudomonas prosekii TaxID=1148509 RepID=A0A3L8CLG6_9PSED|nr:type I restriction enzyme HsdR N-terminal domain-containing protein [Pseudomonas prosekii]RLU09106.1 hypothetical protein CS078_13200 [Pseudomonas prosekii]RLU11979.1 hypothetical protein CS076_07730 [Pseudomonas prosekii]